MGRAQRPARRPRAPLRWGALLGLLVAATLPTRASAGECEDCEKKYCSSAFAAGPSPCHDCVENHKSDLKGDDCNSDSHSDKCWDKASWGCCIVLTA